MWLTHTVTSFTESQFAVNHIYKIPSEGLYTNMRAWVQSLAMQRQTNFSSNSHASVSLGPAEQELRMHLGGSLWVVGRGLLSPSRAAW